MSIIRVSFITFILYISPTSYASIENTHTCKAYWLNLGIYSQDLDNSYKKTLEDLSSKIKKNNADVDMSNLIMIKNEIADLKENINKLINKHGACFNDSRLSEQVISFLKEIDSLENKVIKMIRNKNDDKKFVDNNVNDKFIKYKNENLIYLKYDDNNINIEVENFSSNFDKTLVTLKLKVLNQITIQQEKLAAHTYLKNNLGNKLELYAISSNLNSPEINKGSELKITFHFQENAMIITQNLEFIIDKNVLGNRYPIHFNFNLQELR